MTFGVAAGTAATPIKTARKWLNTKTRNMAVANARISPMNGRHVYPP